MNRSLLTPIMLIFMLILTGIFATSALAATTVKPYVGFTAPDATVLDLQGNSVVLSEVIAKNKVTIIHFSTTWCPYCNKEVPDLRKLYQQYGSQGLEIVSISFNEKTSILQSWVDKTKPGFPIYQDQNLAAHGKYQVVVIPVSFVVDQSGTIRNKIGHSVTYSTFESAVLSILKAN